MKSTKTGGKKPVVVTKLSKVEMLKKVMNARRRQVSKNNAAFGKMSPAEKRVQIARDVLAQLATGRLKATSGVWLTGKGEKNLYSEKDLKKDPELQEILQKTPQCEGCALGGMFMCAVERADKLKLSEMSGGYDSYDKTASEEDTFSYMKRFFSSDQLALIEYCFELGDGAAALNGKKGDQALNFFSNDNGDDLGLEAQLRMQLIMENIVANKGKFVVTKRPVMEFKTPGYVG